MSDLKAQYGIRNIIFDFGGVILNISHKKLEEAFRLIGVHNFGELFNQAQQSDLFQKYEIGEISSGEFRDEVRRLTGLQVSDDILDNAWNQIIGDFPSDRIDLLKKIGVNYNLFLLSNTNEIHYDYYIEKFRIEYGYAFHSLFQNTYWSYKIGKRKPNPDAYSEIIINEKLIPAETLFIDDSKQNIIAAEALGLKSFHLQHNVELTELFDGSLLKVGL